jgi:hypothetical protein
LALAAVLLDIVATLAGAGIVHARAGQVPGRAVVADAQRLLEAFEFDQVVSRLDSAIAAMVASPDPDLGMLAQAYDLRGQAHFNLDDQEQAARDFELLLQARPDYELAADLSPRIVDLFTGVKRRLVGILMITMPRAGVVTIDGRTYQVEREAMIELIQGDHEFAIRQPGFRDESRRVSITAGEFTMLTATMERISGTLSVVTVPDGTRVLVDDVLRGVTAAGPGGGDESAALLVDELVPGQHRLRLERDCFVPYETEFSVANPPGDQVTSPLELTPAVAAVSVETTARDAMIYVDGEPRGLAPAELVDLCEGQHVIEVRAPNGRFVDRRTWDAGATVTLAADLRPAFAIVEVAGASGPDADELARRVEAALGATRGLLIFAPTRGELEAAAQDQRLAVGLSGDDATVIRRRDLAGVWAQRLNTQGVAWLEAVPGEPEAFELFLLAKDSGHPDVVQLAMGDVGSRAAAERRLGAPTPPIARTTIDASVVDVAGVVGAAVIRVEAGGVGELAGLRPGDLIAGAAGTAVTSASDLARVLADAEPGGLLSLDVRGDDGIDRATAVRVALVPDTIPLSDSGLLYNRVLLDLQARAENADTDLLRSASRLSVAIAHMHLESWDLAFSTLDAVALPDGTGVSAATVDYLMGLCLREIGQLDEAREAFRRAVDAGEGTLSVGGPAVASLAQRALDSLP